MNKRLFFCSILFAVLLAATGLWAADSTLPAPASDMFPETSFRFDPVVEGSEVIHDFVVHNKTADEMTIHQVKTG
ncbi:MAG: hypothetical protein AB7S77_13655 [Desulfatirhabdiaceae bacterium]